MLPACRGGAQGLGKPRYIATPLHPTWHHHMMFLPSTAHSHPPTLPHPCAILAWYSSCDCSSVPQPCALRHLGNDNTLTHFLLPQTDSDEVIVDESKIIHVWKQGLDDAFKEISEIVTTVRGRMPYRIASYQHGLSCSTRSINSVYIHTYIHTYIRVHYIHT